MVGMKGTPSQARARALALAAVRETFEEAGLLIGRPRAAPLLTKAPGWQAFYAAGFAPALAQLTFFARAITPPGRPRRYDTRFFCVAGRSDRAQVGVADGELSDLEWHSIAQARTLELPNITRVVLEDLGERIAAGALAHIGSACAVLSPPQRKLPSRPDHAPRRSLTNRTRRIECAPAIYSTRVRGRPWQNQSPKRSSC